MYTERESEDGEEERDLILPDDHDPDPQQLRLDDTQPPTQVDSPVTDARPTATSGSLGERPYLASLTNNP